MVFKEVKELWVKVKWILRQSKPVIPFLIFTIVVSSALSLIGVYNALVSKSLIDSAIAGNTPAVIKWLIVMATIMFGRILISPITSFMSTHASMSLTQKMQKRIYEHVTYSKWEEQSKFHSVSLLTRITSDVGTITSTLLGTIPAIISLSVTLIASFSTLVMLAPSIAIAAVFIGPVLLIISRLFAGKLKKLYKESQEADVRYRSFMQETIQNIMIVKTFCMEKINLGKLEDIQKDKYDLAMKNTKLSVISGMSMGLCSTLAYFTIFCWGALNISKGLGTYGTFTAMLQLYSNIQGPFSGLAGIFPRLIGAIAATERLMELEELNLEENIKPKETLFFTNPEIIFKDISFGYNDGATILENITLDIPSGETIAFVGPSGEGKTTMIRLILSLIKGKKGQVVLNEAGKSENIDRNHRNLISYVPQGNTLFSGTIKENLQYGKPNATDEEIKEALKAACALDFINELENGLDTLVGEKGHGISEGQAQRIAIARAFLREKPILILDEATSALDPETEVNVLREIRSLKHSPTCIIITHRPSALDICNKIIKLERGHVKEVSKESILEVAAELV
ncbi:ABC transporter ATP-binding protein [Clostridium sp.]|uniref:ABC transporter ATP-binding protein n=1 Tax=Clostridium sp. TaxID=1506 RepID=UPI003F350A77